MTLEEYLHLHFGPGATSSAVSPATQNQVSPATQNQVSPATGDLLRKTLSAAPMAMPIQSTVLTSSLMPVQLHRDLSQTPREERLLRDEKCQFINYCWQLRQKGTTWQNAVKIVALEQQHALPRLAAKNMMTLNNLRNWRARLCADPDHNRPASEKPDFRYADNLIRNYGGNTGSLKGDPAFCKQLLALCSCRNQVKLSKEYRQLADKWLTAYPDRQIPTLTTFRYWLKKLPPRLFALAVKGPAYYAQHYQNYVPRDPESLQVNEAWVGDNLECDFYIRADNGKAVRPWLTAIQDIKSEYIVGMVLSDDGVNSADIRAALAGAVLEYGRPKIFLTDNGADFCRRGFTTPVVFTPDVSNSKVYEHCILKELDIEHRVAAPYNAKAKLVERFFHELNEYSRQARGWIGNKIDNRPASADLWSRPENVKFLMDKTQAAAFIAEKLGIFHNRPAPDSKYLKGLSPRQAFLPERRMQRPALAPLDLAFAFLTPVPESRIVEPRGPSVKIGGVRYVAREGAQRLWHYDNRPVMVKFDMQSVNYCFIFDLDGQFLSVAHAESPVPYFAEGAAEKDALSKVLEENRREEKILRNMILRQTGNFEKLDAQTIAMLPPDAFEGNARLRLVDSKTSVKGDTHNPKIYVPAAEFETMTAEIQPRRIAAASAPRQKLNPELHRDILAVINGDSDNTQTTSEQVALDINDTEEGEETHEPSIINPY